MYIAFWIKYALWWMHEPMLELLPGVSLVRTEGDLLRYKRMRDVWFSKKPVRL